MSVVPNMINLKTKMLKTLKKVV